MENCKNESGVQEDWDKYDNSPINNNEKQKKPATGPFPVVLKHQNSAEGGGFAGALERFENRWSS